MVCLFGRVFVESNNKIVGTKALLIKKKKSRTAYNDHLKLNSRKASQHFLMNLNLEVYFVLPKQNSLKAIFLNKMNKLKNLKMKFQN